MIAIDLSREFGSAAKKSALGRSRSFAVGGGGAKDLLICRDSRAANLGLSTRLCMAASSPCRDCLTCLRTAFMPEGRSDVIMQHHIQHEAGRTMVTDPRPSVAKRPSANSEVQHPRGRPSGVLIAHAAAEPRSLTRGGGRRGCKPSICLGSVHASRKADVPERAGRPMICP